MLRIRRQDTEITLKGHLSRGQTAIEYLLLFGIVVSVVLVGFQVHIARIPPAANKFFLNSVNQIYGKASPCGDGSCSVSEARNDSCPCDCGPAARCY